jgi:hypothetical protein
MTLYLHVDTLDYGLSVLQAATLSMCVCQGAPTTRAEAVDLLSGTGKRVSNIVAVSGASVSLADGPQANTRRVTIAAHEGEVAETVDAAVAELWVAAFDDSRLLLVTDEITDQALLAGNPITLPEVRVTFIQPVLEEPA